MNWSTKNKMKYKCKFIFRNTKKMVRFIVIKDWLEDWNEEEMDDLRNVVYRHGNMGQCLYCRRNCRSKL